MRHALAFLLLLVPAAAHADAGAREPITLADAIATALAGNDGVLGARAEVEVAAAGVAAARGADDLVVEVEVGALTRRAEPIDGPFFQETSLAHAGASVAVWKPLATGGRVGLSVRDDVSRTEARVEAAGMRFDLDYTIHAPRAELVFVQPLLRGAGSRAWRAERRAAAAERDAVAAERDRAEAALVHDVTRTYWELAYAGREVAIRRGALALAREQLEVTRARAEVGTGSELEVLAVEQAIAAREAALLGAEQIENDRALALRVLLGADAPGAPRLAAADAIDAATGAAPAEPLARALRFSPDLRALAGRARAAAVLRDAAARDLLPQLDLVVRGGPTGTGGAAADAFEQLATADGYAAQATLTFSIPIGNTTAKARHAAARLRERRLGHAADELRGEVTAAVQRAVDAIALAERRIAAAAKAVELARRTVDLELARWQTGAGTNFDVLERQDQLAAAEAALARAHADLRIAGAGLAYLTGDP